MKQNLNPSNLYSKDTLNKYFCYSIALLLILAPLISNSQTCDDYWVSTLPAEGRNSKPVIDNAGFIYQVGVIPNQGSTVQGLILAKYTQTGKIVWSRSFSGTFWAFRMRVTVYNDNLYLGGSYRSADFQDGNGTILSTDDELDPFILKMDTAGTVIALQTFPGTGRDEFLGFNHDSQGNLYFSGRFRQTLVLPNAETLGLTASTIGEDTWVALIKLDNNLNLIWSKISNLNSTGGNQAARGFELIIDDLDNIYMGGYFSYELNFGDAPLVNSTFRRNPYVAKFDKNGNNLWIHGTSTIDDSFSTVYALTLDAQNNVYYAGQISTEINVGGTEYFTNGTFDGYLAKLNNDGTPVWFNPIGTSGGFGGLAEWPGVVGFDSNGDLYLVASAHTQNDGVVILDSNLNSVDFGTDQTITIYVAKYDPSTGLLIDAHKALHQSDFVGRGGIVVGDKIFRSGSSAFLVGELLSGQNVELFSIPDIEIEGIPSILAGDSVKLNAIAPNAVSYQWLLDDVAIPGATDLIYYAKDQGKYELEIENSFGCIISSLPESTINLITLQSGNVYTVNSTDDLGDINPGDGFCLDNLSNCTLRAAIEESNTITQTVDTIKFNISGVGPHTIQPNSGFPIITDPVVIDGTTEPDFVDTPIIELDGTNAGNAIGLHFSTARSILKGLVINRFDQGVRIAGINATGNIIQGNYIGTDPTGLTAQGNLFGVFVCCGAQVNTIGGTTEDERNLISGNNGIGLLITNFGTEGNKVLGNYIGTDVSGTVALRNTGDGVTVRNFSSNNWIGGESDGEGNLISGNDQNGIGLFDSYGNIVQGNYIGTDVNGTADLGNSNAGISINGSNNLVGGSGNGAGNLISGNGLNGVEINGSNAIGNLVQGNYIGTDVSGTADLGNSSGVGISNGAKGNIIGGSGAGARNIISGNDQGGVGIDFGAELNVVAGNFIGTDLTGMVALPNGTSANSQHGIAFGTGAKLNRIGTDADGVSDEMERNIISGNHGSGILIGGEAEQNVIAGNYIGTDVSGLIALPNGSSGIGIGNGHLNIIGGSNTAARNLISGNFGSGVHIGVDAEQNVLAGNYIGTDVTGTVALANGGDGVVIKGGQLNTIGGTVEESGNVISGNDGNGVMLTDSGTEGNKVIGNFIGTNVTGFVALGNAANGVFIRALASNNWIGGKSDGEGNLISGNTDYGVLITDIGSDSNTVAGNYIGTDITGTDSIPNNQGVGIWDSAKFNVIGTNGDGVSDLLERNIISGNSLNGVEISNSAEQNIVAGNLIGTDVTGTIAIPNAHGGNAAGVGIANGPKLNLIGTNNDGVSDELERNIISGNNGSGIDFFNSGGLNIIAGNYIGTDITGTDSLGNGLNGITLFGTSEDNQILKNLIAFNNEPAIRFLGQASGNIIGGDSVENGNTIFNNAGGIVLSSTVVNIQILFNTFSNNGDLAIDLNEDGITENDALDPDTGANNLQNFPVIESAYFTDCDSLVVVYNIDSDTVNSAYPLRVQFYAANGEKFIIEDDYTAQDFETGSKILNVGNILNVVEGDSLISTATDAEGNTSEFSSSIEVISKITELVITSLTACDSPNGAVSATVNNITTGFTFEWWNGTDTSGASDFTGDTYSGIPAGTYTVIATDSISGCESTVSIEVIDEIVIPAIANTSLVNSSFCNKPNGSIEVTAVNPGVLADYSFTWYNGSVDPSNIITNQTGSTLTDLAAGDYYLVATNSTSGCESAPVSLSINDDACIVGFNSLENPTEINLRIFPNPSDDDIIVKFDNQNREQFRIQIFDNRGRKTFEIKSNSNEQIEIPAYQLKKGINILILTINNNSYPMRFLKN